MSATTYTKETLDQADQITGMLTTDEITTRLAELRLEIEPHGLDVALALADICDKLELTGNQTRKVLGPSLYHLITGEPIPTLTHLTDWARIKASDLVCPHCGEPLVYGDAGSIVCQGCTRSLVLVDLVMEGENA